MAKMSPLLEELIETLSVLPGIGPRSAQRLAFYLLAKNRTGGLVLAEKLKQSLQNIQHCKRCRTFSETTYCGICLDSRRDSNILCVVETPADILAIESSHAYSGKYFVLLGKLSPLEGTMPSDLGLDHFKHLIQSEAVQEVIVATNLSVEGEVTAQYIAEICNRVSVKASRIAQGIPMGGELDLVDSLTLSHALSDRKKLLPD